MASQEHLDILQRGTQVWNTWRSSNLSVIPDLSDCSLSLMRDDYQKVNFYRCNLNGANAYRCKFDGALLKEANLSHADFASCSSSKANLMSATLTHTCLVNTNLASIKGDNADFSFSNASGADFSLAELTEAKFNGTKFGIDWAPDRVNMKCSCFQNAQLSQSSFSKCVLDVDHYYLLRYEDYPDEYEVLSETGDDDEQIWHVGNRHLGINFNGANLIRADFSDSTLYLDKPAILFADFRRSTLIETKFDRANISASLLWETQRSDWSIRGITCSSASWDRDGSQLDYYETDRFERAFANRHRIFLEYAGGITPIELALLPLAVEEISKAHNRCNVNLKLVEDLGSRSTVVISVLDTKKMEGDRFEEEFVSLRRELTRAQRLISREISRRKEAEMKLEFALGKVIPTILEQAMGSKKTVNIGQVQGNYVDAEKAGYVEVGRGGTSQALADLRFQDLILYLDQNAANIKTQMSLADWEQVLVLRNTLDHQIHTDRPSQPILTEALASLRKIAESASGSLLAVGIKSFLGF
jgi:uncharacterized protein YjbI with pentapeptide repeats